MLAPIDGRLLYLRRGKDVRESEEQAIQEADVTLESISLHLSSVQPSLCLRKETHLPAIMPECQQHLCGCLSEKAIPLPSPLHLKLTAMGAEDGSGVTNYFNVQRAST